MRKQWLIMVWIFSLLFLGLPLSAMQPTVLLADGSAELPAESKYIALTFDDGPRRGTTDRLLDGLKERGANVTFFLIGEQMEGNEDLVRRMQAEGHQVGNHTWSHVRLQDASGISALQEVRQMEEALQKVLGGSGYWLRPPYGMLDEQERVQISVPMVKWNVDPRDWELRNTAKVTKEILEHAEPNAIILLHDIYPTSVDAALAVVDALQKEGYQFVTVQELLALNGVEEKAGLMYRSGTGST